MEGGDCGAREKLREVYEAAGFQGVYDRRGSAGVHELLRAWRPHQRRMKARDGQEITIGADFCYSHAGGNSYRQHGMGVHFGLSGRGRSGGVFTMYEDDAAFFNDGLERVEQDREGEFRDPEVQKVMQLRIRNSCFGVANGDSGTIEIGRSRTDAESDIITLRFSPGMSGWGDSVAIDRYDAWKVRHLVDDALDEVERFKRAEERAKRVIRRGDAKHRAEGNRGLG